MDTKTLDVGNSNGVEQAGLLLWNYAEYLRAYDAMKVNVDELIKQATELGRACFNEFWANGQTPEAIADLVKNGGDWVENSAKSLTLERIAYGMQYVFTPE